MKITIQIVLENQDRDGEAPIIEEVFSFQPDQVQDQEGAKFAPKNLGLTLEEAN